MLLCLKLQERTSGSNLKWILNPYEWIFQSIWINLWEWSTGSLFDSEWKYSLQLWAKNLFCIKSFIRVTQLSFYFSNGTLLGEIRCKNMYVCGNVLIYLFFFPPFPSFSWTIFISLSSLSPINPRLLSAPDTSLICFRCGADAGWPHGLLGQRRRRWLRHNRTTTNNVIAVTVISDITDSGESLPLFLSLFLIRLVTFRSSFE